MASAGGPSGRSGAVSFSLRSVRQQAVVAICSSDSGAPRLGFKSEAGDAAGFTFEDFNDVNEDSPPSLPFFFFVVVVVTTRAIKEE